MRSFTLHCLASLGRVASSVPWETSCSETRVNRVCHSWEEHVWADFQQAWTHSTGGGFVRLQVLSILVVHHWQDNHSPIDPGLWKSERNWTWVHAKAKTEMKTKAMTKIKTKTKATPKTMTNIARGTTDPGYWVYNLNNFLTEINLKLFELKD